ncbi:MAG: hypothetical protein WC312_04270 [Candidatus Omnitrophota bacterium]|jgi:chromosome segregation ATPase
MKNSLKFTLIAIGVAAIFFVMGREIMETRSRLNKTRDQVAREKKEKAWLRDELKTVRHELIGTKTSLRSANSKLNFVNKKIAGLRGSNNKLILEKYGLERKIVFLQEEKKAMEDRLHSLSELKNAIRLVKAEMRDDRIRRHKERIRQQEEIDRWETALGNRGFFTRDGEPSYRSKVTVDVRPASLSLNKK